MRNRTFLLAAVAAGALLASQASLALSVGVSINLAPPPLPVYVQPEIPAPGYIWIPGYWSYADDGGYYWVPGTWVEPPQDGYLWTPGYWGWSDGAYLWHGGYWGTHVGFYGGVNYGYGYGGVGFDGGYWRGSQFYYNRSVNNIPASVHVTNVYNRTVVNNVTVNRVSFNGGHDGIQARPSPAELTAEHESHLMPVSAQLQHEQAARGNPALRDSVNHGRPAIAATARPGDFSNHVVAARGTTGTLHTAGASANGHVNANAGAAHTPGNAFAGGNAGPARGESAHAPTNSFNHDNAVPRTEFGNHNPAAGPPHTALENARPVAHPAAPRPPAPPHMSSAPPHPAAPAHVNAAPHPGGGPGGEHGGERQGGGKDREPQH